MLEMLYEYWATTVVVSGVVAVLFMLLFGCPLGVLFLWKPEVVRDWFLRFQKMFARARA